MIERGTLGDLARTASRRGRASRRKGANGENEFCKLLHAHGWENARRRFGSGIHGGGDVTDGPEGCCIEIKRTARRSTREAFEQCVAGARLSDIPMVAWRADRGPWFMAIEHDELEPLLSLAPHLTVYVLHKRVSRLHFAKAWGEVSLKAAYDWLRVLVWEPPDGPALSFVLAEDLLPLLRAREIA